jgi:hypothetical protein
LLKTLITGMGRSGTKWLSEFLCVPHEPRPTDAVFTPRHYRGEYDENYIDKLVQAVPDFANVECNSHLRYAVEPLKKKGVEVIGLFRHPSKVVASLFNCKAYRLLDTDFHPTRGYHSDEICDKWHSMSSVERLCWYYNYSVCRLYPQCDYQVKLETLISNWSEMQGLGSILRKHFSMDRWQAYKDRLINRTPEERRHADLRAINELVNIWCHEAMSLLNYSSAEVQA